MKKLVLTSVCALATAGAAFAQGIVNWNIISFSSMTAQTNSTTRSSFTGGGSAVGGSVGAAGGSSVSGANFYYELLYTSYSGTQAAVPTTLAALGTWSDAGLGATNNSTSAGRLVPINANAGAQVPWSPGTTDSIMLAGWSANLGTTWAAVIANLNSPSFLNAVAGNAFFGLSNTGYTTTLSTSTSPGASVFGANPTAQGLPIQSLLTQLYLVQVPEPGTLALMALGGAALLFRRKK